MNAQIQWDFSTEFYEKTSEKHLARFGIMEIFSERSQEVFANATFAASYGISFLSSFPFVH